MRQARLPPQVPVGNLHSLYWSLNLERSDKNRHRSLLPDQVGTAHQQVASFRRNQCLSAELVRVCEQLCQARLA